MTSYSVVHFYEDNSVEAVPSFWINKDGTYCAWPKNKYPASKLIERKSIPNECKFDYFKSRILKSNFGKIKVIIYYLIIYFFALLFIFLTIFIFNI